MEALKINKCLNPGKFFLGSYLVLKELRVLLSRRLSAGRLVVRSMSKPNQCTNTNDVKTCPPMLLLRQSRHVNNVTVHTRTCVNRNDVIFIYTRRHGDVTLSRPTSCHPDKMEKLTLIFRPKSTSKKGVNISLKYKFCCGIMIHVYK
jgi:hypothetical protein